MRRGLETAVRALRIGPAASLVLLGLVLLAALPVDRRAPPPVGAYEVAFLGGAWACARIRAMEPALWPWSHRQVDALLGLGVATGAWLLDALVGATQPEHRTHANLLHLALGALHLGALAVLVRRLQPGPRHAALLFVALGWILPALWPAVAPFLDPRGSFHAGHFPRWEQAVPPILSLVLLAQALPVPAALRHAKHE